MAQIREPLKAPSQGTEHEIAQVDIFVQDLPCSALLPNSGLLNNSKLQLTTTFFIGAYYSSS